MRRTFHSLTVTCLLAAAVTGNARADVVLSGPDSNAGVYSTSALQADAGANTVSAGGLTGLSLWAFLGGANASGPTSPIYGAITTSTPAGDNGKNAILRYYLIATNATGQQSVVSLGEIDPSFGGASSTPAPFVAFSNNGSGLLTSPELVLPNQPGRDLSNLTSLQLVSAPAITGAGGQSTSVQLSGNVTAPGSYNRTALQGLPSFTETIAAANDTYTGVPLWSFLNPTTTGGTNQIVVTQGTDGYEVVLALAELDPSLGATACAAGVTTCDILPYADTGTAFPADGLARTIYPGDTSKQGRWESNLDAVFVESDLPEPASLAMFAAAVAGLGAIRRRRASRRR